MSAASNDVWVSYTNGSSWSQAVASASWFPRFDHDTVVFQDKIFVMGGAAVGGTSFFNDVWTSTDGVAWNLVIGSAAWDGRRVLPQ